MNSIYKCIDCGSPVSRKGTLRCKKCHSKHVSKLLKGRKLSKEHKDKLSLSHKGKVPSKDARLKMSMAHFERQGGELRKKNSGGYITVYVPTHPNKMKSNSRVFEHRLVMEKKLGRYLQPDEVVHHLNRVKDDNRIENLYLVSRTEHRKYEVSMLTCPKCGQEIEIKLF